MNLFRNREPAPQSELSPCGIFTIEKNFSTSSWVVTPTSSESSNQGHAAHHFPLPAQTDHSTRAPNPKTFRARIRQWEGPILLLAGTLKLAVIIVSIWLVCGIDHPGPLPQPDSAHYNVFKSSLSVNNFLQSSLKQQF